MSRHRIAVAVHLRHKIHHVLSIGLQAERCIILHQIALLLPDQVKSLVGPFPKAGREEVARIVFKFVQIWIHIHNHS